jgi:hypothetical protein
MSKYKSPAPEQTQTPEQPAERIFGSSVKIYSDQFKGSIEKMVRDDSWNEVERLIEIEHVHLFRTYDSDGKRQGHCQAVGGHTHEIIWAQDETGAAKIKSVSGPVKQVRKKVKGKFVLAYEACNDYDEHTHEFEYIKSDVVEARRTNAQAAQYLGAEAQKIPTVSGVQPMDR